MSNSFKFWNLYSIILLIVLFDNSISPIFFVALSSTKEAEKQNYIPTCCKKWLFFCYQQWQLVRLYLQKKVFRFNAFACTLPLLKVIMLVFDGPGWISKSVIWEIVRLQKDPVFNQLSIFKILIQQKAKI